MALLNFNANTVEPTNETDEFKAIPAGEYKVEITGSEMNPTKNGDGERLSLTFKILEGPFSGRLLWEGLNLVNPSQKAVEIAQRTLSQICHATGRMNITDSSQLHGVPMLVKVIVKSDSQYGDSDGNKNEIKSYKNAGVATPGMGNAVQASPNVGAPPTAGAPSSAPWQAPAQGAA